MISPSSSSRPVLLPVTINAYPRVGAPWWIRVIAMVLIPIQVLTTTPFLIAADNAARAAIKEASLPPKIVTPEKLQVNRTLPKSLTRAAKQPRMKNGLPEFSPSPKTEEISATRLFPEPLLPVGGVAPSPAENKELVGALQAFAAASPASSIRENAEPLRLFLQTHPQSPWAASLWLSLGLVDRRTGYFTRALGDFEKAWLLAKVDASSDGTAIANTAIAALIELQCRTGRIEQVAVLLNEIEKRPMSGAASTKIAEARSAINSMRQHPGDSYRCGVLALAKILEQMGQATPDLSKIIFDAKSSERGFSLLQVQEFAQRVGLDYLPAKFTPAIDVSGRAPAWEIPVPAVVHWKIGHYAALVSRMGDGRYVMRDPTFGEDIVVTPRALAEESTGEFLVAASAIKGQANWRALTKSEAAQVWGKGWWDRIKGWWFGPNNPFKSCGGSQGPMASYSMDFLEANLNITDTPLGYSPAWGPGVAFTLSYNQYDSLQPAVFTSTNLGPRWTCTWLSYIEDTGPSSPAASVNRYLPGGGQVDSRDYDAGTSNYAPDRDGAIIHRVDDNKYEVRFLDGSTLLYDLPDGAVSGTRKVYMTAVRNPLGQTLRLIWDTAHLRLEALVDATGLVTTLGYAGSTPGTGDFYRLLEVTDPYGRKAQLSYYENGHLSSITDIIGITSHFTYGEADFINTLTTPYGVTHFETGMPASGNLVRWLEATGPDGGKERVETWNYNAAIAQAEAHAPSLPGVGVENENLSFRNSLYWGRKAFVDGTAGRPESAEIYHWLHGEDSMSITGILSSHKLPGLPRTFVVYEDQPNLHQAGRMQRVIASGQAIQQSNGDWATQAVLTSYNAQGKPTQVTDPLGRQTQMVYASNGVDCTEIRQVNGAGTDLLTAITYDTNHLPLTVTDAAGQVTTMTYTPLGQVATVTNALSETTTMAYYGATVVNPAHERAGRLATVTGPASGSTVTYDYDPYGRVRTVTSPEGDTVTTDYDTLGRPTVVTYPGTAGYEQNVYDRLSLASHRDISGDWSRFWVDALGRTVLAQDALGRTLNYNFCQCGQLTALTDAAGQTTRWDFDAVGRMTKKTLPDGTIEQALYDPAGRLSASIDGRGLYTRYAYTLDDKLSAVAYTNAGGTVTAHDVAYTYDDIYGRMATMTDALGTTTYSYNAVGGLGAGKLASVDGPLSGTVDEIDYTYDELGRGKTVKLGSGTTTEINSATTFDNLGRATAIVSTLGTFGYSYDGITGRVTQVTAPNGVTTSLSYAGVNGLRRLTQLKHQDSSGNILSQHDYSYSVDGQIVNWTRQLGPTAATDTTQFHFGYDRIGQLTQAALTNTGGGTPAPVSNWSYSYDKAGNRTHAQASPASGPASAATATYNTGNQLTVNRQGADGSGNILTHVAGTTTEPASVNVNSQAATMTGNATNFSALVPMPPGTNSFTVAATDGNSNTATRNYTVVVGAGANRTLTYDDDGNCLSDGAHTYTYDGAGRMTAIDETGSSPALRTEFTYDGAGRRTSIVEKRAGVAVSNRRYVFSGNAPAREIDATTGTILRDFLAHGEIRYGAGTAGADLKLYYTRDHQGSLRELADDTGAVRARYDYDPYGKRSKLAGDLDSDVGFTGHWQHEVSGLALTLFRAYSSELGRWLSRDPTAEGGGMNLYDYCANDPTNSVDPLGLCVTGRGIAITIGISILVIAFLIAFPVSIPAILGAAVLGAISGGLLGGLMGAYLGTGFIEGAISGAIIGSMTGIAAVILAPLAGLVGGGIMGGALVGGVSSMLGNLAFQGVQNVRGLQSGIDSEQLARAGVFGAIGGSIFLRPSVSAQQLVTTWAPQGVTPTITFGRWVMLGGNNPLNKALSGVPYPSTNSASAIVPGSILQIPPGWEAFKFLIGQRVIK